MTKPTYKQIEAMSGAEWLNYRDNLLEEYYRRGHVLKPNIQCWQCNAEEDYTCFECECAQLNETGL